MTEPDSTEPDSPELAEAMADPDEPEHPPGSEPGDDVRPEDTGETYPGDDQATDTNAAGWTDG